MICGAAFFHVGVVGLCGNGIAGSFHDEKCVPPEERIKNWTALSWTFWLFPDSRLELDARRYFLQTAGRYFRHLKFMGQPKIKEKST